MGILISTKLNRLSFVVMRDYFIFTHYKSITLEVTIYTINYHSFIMHIYLTIC